MEVDNVETKMQCFKIPSDITGNLRMACDVTNSIVVLWSKYEIFVYENLDFRQYLGEKIEPQFEIEQVIVLKNIVVCLDCSGNVNILDIYDSSIIWKQDIKCICSYESRNTYYLVFLQFDQNGAMLLVHEFNSNDFPNDTIGLKFPLPYDLMTPEENCIMVSAEIKSDYLIRAKNKFGTDDTQSNHLLVIICLNTKNVYYSVLKLTENSHDKSSDTAVKWEKLYGSHTTIIDIKINTFNDICAIIGLAGGNIIKIPLLNTKHTAEVYHLNATIDKFAMIRNTIIYTDALTMWKCENTFSETDCTFEQFVVRNIRDFCVIGNQVICVTFANLIYYFNIGHRSSYIKPLDTDYTCPVKLVTNSDYLQEIMDVVRRNEELLKKINKESEYLMALSLSKRQDIMDSLIQVSTNVFDNYRDIATTNTDVTLTDNLNAYYDLESYYFLINVSVNRVQHKLNRLLSDVLGDLKIHITLLADGILKTTSVQIKEQLRTKNFVVPLKRKINISRIQVHIKIITKIPGKFDVNQKLWTVLYEKCLDLKAENFINIKHSTNHTLLKNDETSLEMLIYKRAKHLHGSNYKFSICDERHQWTLLVKLFENCTLNVDGILSLIDPTDLKQTCVSLKHLVKASMGKKSIEFQVGNEPVKLNIEDGNLKVTCSDIIIASDIRNYFSSIILASFKDNLRKEFVDHKYYTKIENLKRDLISCIGRRIPKEDFAILLNRFLRNVYCLIPI